MKDRHCIKTYSNQTMAMVEDALSRPWRYHVTFRDIILPGTSPDWFPYDQNIEFKPLGLNTRIPGIARPLEPPRPPGPLGLASHPPGLQDSLAQQVKCKRNSIAKVSTSNPPEMTVLIRYDEKVGTEPASPGSVSTHGLVMAETIAGIIYQRVIKWSKETQSQY